MPFHVQDFALGAGNSVLSQQTSAGAFQPTLNNYITVFAWGFNITTNGTPPSISDTSGNSYTIAAGTYQFLSNSIWCAIAYAKVAATGSSFRAIATAAAGWSIGDIVVVASEFSGLPPTSPQDGAAVGTTGIAAQSFSPGNMTVVGNDLVLAVMVNKDTNAGANLTDPAGWTIPGKETNGSTFTVGAAAYQVNPASPSNPTWTTSDLGVVWGASQVGLGTGVLDEDEGIRYSPVYTWLKRARPMLPDFCGTRLRRSWA